MTEEKWVALVMMIVLLVMALVFALVGGLFLVGAVITFMSGEVSAGLVAVVIGLGFAFLSGMAGIGSRDFAVASHEA